MRTASRNGSHHWWFENRGPKCAVQSVSGANIAKIAAPLVLKLQKRLAAGEISSGTTILSIGESDLLDLNGRAAIFSLKPIISDSGDIEQEPGAENLHLAVRYLDGVLLSELAQDYQFQDLTFVRQPIDGADKSSVALLSASGHTIGYFQWQPFNPGASVIQAVSPVIVVVGLSAFLLMSFLGHAIWRRSTSLAKSQEELRHLAMHDPLTGLANRTTFHRTLVQSLESATAEKGIAVMFVDLDHFKEVNDSFGHPVGDSLIKEVASRLKEIAPSALVSRIGGDEFTLLLPAEDLKAIDWLAEEMIQRLRMPFQIEGSLITVGASIGISLSSPGVEATEMTRRADIALYHAKAAGRNTFAVFGSHMEEVLRRRRALESDLAIALETGTQLAVHFQPVYAAMDGRMSSMEALCRWMHPTFGAISPDVFVPIAEECGLIQKLGLYVLEEACSLLAEVPESDIGISVNASAIERLPENRRLPVKRSVLAMPGTSLPGAARSEAVGFLVRADALAAALSPDGDPARRRRDHQGRGRIPSDFEDTAAAQPLIFGRTPSSGRRKTCANAGLKSVSSGTVSGQFHSPVTRRRWRSR